MKKIILLLVGIISLGLFNFSSAGSYTYTGTVSYSYTPTANGYRKILPLHIPFDKNPLIESVVLHSSSDHTYSPDVNCVLTNNGGDIPSNFAISYTFISYLNGTTAGYDDTSNSVSGFGTLSSRYFNTSQSDYILAYVSLSIKFPSINTYNLNFDYSCTFSGDDIMDLSSLNSTCPTIDQNYCTSNNLCPTCSTSTCDYSDYILKSDVTQNYCEVEYNLIDPENCPTSGGTGDIQRSSFWVNDRQLQGASSIYLYMPDFLSWDYTYLNSGSTLQIDVVNEGDTDYIQNVLDVQTYHPTSDEFAVSFVGYLTLLMPYIIITLFIVFIWKLIKRVFK